MPALTQQLAQTDTAATDTRQVERIDALTSLRFIAAAMIVVTHSVYALTWTPPAISASCHYRKACPSFCTVGLYPHLCISKPAGHKKDIALLSARIARVCPAFFVTGDSGTFDLTMEHQCHHHR
ncbi:MAG: hypothetical protein IPL73_06005 [Candidatus Obscuribacter sp.]|nr:hypothetical protein [Candidatus Obscuribacter sp.]